MDALATPTGATTDHRGTTTTRAPRRLRVAVRSLETAAWPDRIAGWLEPLGRTLSRGKRGEVLRGEWLGHALHPLLTDLPLGCWLGSGLLDIVGGARSRGASRRLVGLGILAAVPTAASGLADWSASSDSRVRRVGAVHAAGNALMLTTYTMSWHHRRRGRHSLGVGFGLAGGALGWVTGYLGGHLSFNLGSGIGDRGLRERNDASASTR